MSSCSKKKYILNTVAVNLGCGSGCKRPRLSSIFQPKPRDKPYFHHQPRHYHSSSSSCDATTFSSTADTPPAYCSSETESDFKNPRVVQGFGRINGESVAVEKDSDDPYLDFRHSMLQMILEKEIYSKDDLKELLNCFLRLNSPYYHGIIVRAFTEIWNGVYSVKSGSPNLNLHGM
ncbi:Ovate family protein [Forsythia ovata]|uniref:Transcription repressor n=1 Tax=Forsythia ovata TaxID=205694 RepID=A0ABD1SQT5_9LAMI